MRVRVGRGGTPSSSCVTIQKECQESDSRTKEKKRQVKRIIVSCLEGKDMREEFGFCSTVIKVTTSRKGV